MIYLSKLGVSFLGLSFMLYLVSLQSQSGLLFLILGIIFGCYVINLTAAYVTARHLRLEPPPALAGTEGKPIQGSWEISNTARTTIGLTEARSPWGPLFRIGALAGGETMHITPELPLPKRGVYPFKSLALISSYPFGLVRCYRQLAVSGQFVVYPAPYPCTAPAAAGFEPMVGGKYTGQNRSQSGDSFHGVRPMQPTDPVKLIHWASSSKGQGIMVKEFDEELSGRVSLIIDAEPGDAPPPPPDPTTGKVDKNAPAELLLDWAARATASLMLSALDVGHQVEFLDLASLEQLSVPPFADGSVVLERLAHLEPTPGTLTRERLRLSLDRLPRKSSICLVLTTITPAVIDFIDQDLAADNRKVTLYLPVTARRQPHPTYGAVRFFEAGSLA